MFTIKIINKKITYDCYFTNGSKSKISAAGPEIPQQNECSADVIASMPQTDSTDVATTAVKYENVEINPEVNGKAEIDDVENNTKSEYAALNDVYIPPSPTLYIPLTLPRPPSPTLYPH